MDQLKAVIGRQGPSKAPLERPCELLLHIDGRRGKSGRAADLPRGRRPVAGWVEVSQRG